MHDPHCIRSDGDWICAPGCTHDRDEARVEERRTLIIALETARTLLSENQVIFGREWNVERLEQATKQIDDALKAARR